MIQNYTNRITADEYRTDDVKTRKIGFSQASTSPIHCRSLHNPLDGSPAALAAIGDHHPSRLHPTTRWQHHTPPVADSPHQVAPLVGSLLLRLLLLLELLWLGRVGTWILVEALLMLLLWVRLELRLRGHGLLQLGNPLPVHEHVQGGLPLDVLNGLLVGHHSEVVSVNLKTTMLDSA